MKKTILFSALLLSQFGTSQLLKTDGQRIINDKGENIQLRGLGLGGWMLQEGYMLKTADFAGPQYKIKEKIAELIGEDGMQEFYKAYLKNGVTKQDIDFLAKAGFNSIRLPMHYNLYTLPIEKEPVKGKDTWLEEGFMMTDDLLRWCKDNKIYLILDLHAAPGGQGNDANISDNDKTKPSLWESGENQRKTVALWKKLADRYKNEPWIGGYDIINEPNINFTGKNPNGTDEMSNAPLWKLQKDITTAIREVDQKHIIFIEGNGWGNNYNGLIPIWDKNMAFSFHKYWNYNDDQTIQFALDLREKHNLPIWLGETGENSNVWFTELIQLLDKHNIGYAFWPMKKIDNIAGITNVKTTPEYEKLLEYWKNGGEKPSKDYAKKALMQIADNYKLNNTEVKNDVIDAMFRQTNESATKPFKNHSAPGRIFASEYDLGRMGSAYLDKDFINLWVSDPAKRSEWNSGQQMRNDGVDIYLCSDKITNQYYVGKTEAGEWMQYTIRSNAEKNYRVEIRYSSIKPAKIRLEDAAGKILAVVPLQATGKNENWATAVVQNIRLKKGENKLRVHFEDDGVNLNYFEIK
ncbi:carbohydrate-binding protein [Chryseobacterium indologenes]|uniref:cellulase family glycosylhydrolase n=1 Tax=Chryseobacterium indologenes TaxID=253 RepID=UPI000F50A53A|nr:cellulase family glycosylhydrolase [Chryseobacterium indologenes]AYZ35284.1 carbohydrate-binding protein [Chryseobacterium indologenes]MBF6644019.1 cellulase family glycosylhydrolase [Chryseobacterium indologenes]MBU3048790.1 cellulase family glycosylhydrolase [Chryseobacterium indologenes]MEB4761385.1 cellulase family glycosylhydrolase [Chryseobacterium indologenes]QQQ72256.1 cellulase family glycosylhydrolase [Chryseobacterium indologenes]